MAARYFAGLLAILVSLVRFSGTAQEQYLFKNPEKPIEERISNILSLMVQRQLSLGWESLKPA
jgi:hypothetical protein